MFIGLTVAFLFSLSMVAQEKTEVTIKVKKDGKVVQDTTYQFDDADEAKHAVKMMEILSGDDKHMMHYEFQTDSDDIHSNAMVFISEDGKKTEIKKFHGDSLIWFSEEGHDGDHVNIIKKKMKDGEHLHGENVIIIKSDDGETIDIMIEKDEDGNIVKKKQMKVIVSGDGHKTWTVDSEDLIDVDVDVYVISGDEGKVELKEILEKHEGEKVKVIVVEKKIHKDMDHDEDSDHDHDEDSDHDHDEDVEVKVE